jgi:hypothetical protein
MVPLPLDTLEEVEEDGEHRRLVLRAFSHHV